MRIFKNIRQQLASENKVMAYLRYAVGEIVLVVIGILIALQVNNWNEQRKSNEKFNAVLEQIYTIIDQDVQKLSNNRRVISQQYNVTDTLLNYPEKIDPKLLPSLLYYIDLIPNNFISEAAHQMDLLEFNPKNLPQSRLYKSIASYVFDKLEYDKFTSKHLSPLLKNYNLPEPSLIFGYSALNNFENINLNFFTKEQQKKVLELIKEVPFKNALQSALSQYSLTNQMISNKEESALTILNLIKQYYPKATLLYQNIGIVGEATPNKNWTENVPMTLIDEQKSIWEIKIKLSDGSVKFRDGNSWIANWGGETFPNGDTKWFGSDIQVNRGYYKVTLNLTEKKYEFEEIKK